MLVSGPVLRSTPSASDSWASDLVHPLPLAAVAILALNDHALKGAGVLPGAVTGKLSDFAGLFFFPMLLAACARKASILVRGRDIGDRQSLATGAAIATGAFFALVKLVPAVNALVSATWGAMVMDPTDLFALPMVGLAAAWMLRDRPSAALESGSLTRHHGRSPARRALDFGAVIAAGLASMATSQSHPPPPPPPPPPLPQPVAIAEDPTCVALTVDTCERTATQTLVVVRAQARSGQTCTVSVLRAEEASAQGHTSADILPKNITVGVGESRTFALTFLRAVDPADRSGDLLARAQIGATGDSGSERVQDVQFVGTCVGR